MKIYKKTYIQDAAIDCLIECARKCAHYGNAIETIEIAKVLMKVANKFDDELVYLRTEDCYADADCPPENR